MNFNPLENKRTRHIIFNVIIGILIVFFALGLGLLVHGFKSNEHFKNALGNINIFNVINVSLDIVLYVVGFILFISLGLEPLKKRNHYFIFMSLIVSLMFTLIADLVSCYANGIPNLWFLLFVSELIYYVLTYVCVTFLASYLILTSGINAIINKNGFIALGIFFIISEISVFITSFSGKLFNIDEKGFFYTDINVSFWILMPLTLLYIYLFVVVILSKIKLRKKLVLMTVVLGPILAYLLEAFFPYLQLVYSAMMISILIITCNVHLSESVELEAKTAELNNQKLTQMMNQIQPHFIYNVLSSIYYLCDKDGQRAKAAINDFAKYLRINVDSVDKSPIVSFKEELEYCKVYLSLEKMRFEEELKIEYDINTTEFNIPSFSIQPLVENAVKHGVSQKPGGGTVKMEVKETSSEYVIRITDDGVGFNESEMFSEERNHVGINNVKYRIEALSNGKLTIKSKPGEGTVSEVIIPKER